MNPVASEAHADALAIANARLKETQRLVESLLPPPVHEDPIRACLAKISHSLKAWAARRRERMRQWAEEDRDDIDEAEGSEQLEWDAAERLLSFSGVVIRRWERVAKHQFAILEAFQAAGWPKQVKVELTGYASLGDTVANLNKGLAGVIRFRRDGTGCGVIWERITLPTRKYALAR